MCSKEPQNEKVPTFLSSEGQKRPGRKKGNFISPASQAEGQMGTRAWEGLSLRKPTLEGHACGQGERGAELH